MKRLIYISIVILMACTFVLAETTKLIEHESTGVGPSREDAIKNGLYNAIAETQGVMISSGDYRFGFQSATGDTDRNEETGKKTVDFDVVSLASEGSTLKTYVDGLVQKYEVIEEAKDDNGHKVKLKVWILKHMPLENTKRVRLAIMPIKSLKDQYVFGILTKAEDISALLSQRLSNNLTDTNKFLVLDREYTEEHFHEKWLLANDSPIEEQAKMNESLGADYAVVGKVSDAFLVQGKKELAAIGRKVNEYRGRFVFDFRVVAGPTRSVKYSDTVELNLETEDVKALFEVWEPSKIDIKEITDKIVAKAAEMAADNIAQSFYPIKIVKVAANGTIIIDRGNNRVEKGQLLNVYVGGEEITDIDTGESLGTVDVKIATIEVQHVLAKMAQAVVIDGDLAKISRGKICKNVKAAEALSGRKSDVHKSSAGGIIMPFDK